MSEADVDAYLAALEPTKRATLEILRASIADIIPEAEQGLSYGVPVFRIGGRPIAGFSAAAHHLSYLPHSGDVLASIEPDELEGFSATKGAVKMPVGTPLPSSLLRLLIERRRAEARV